MALDGSGSSSTVLCAIEQERRLHVLTRHITAKAKQHNQGILPKDLSTWQPQSVATTTVQTEQKGNDAVRSQTLKSEAGLNKYLCPTANQEA